MERYIIMGSSSGIRDNRERGNVGDFLAKHITPGSQLSFVSAYFTIYAYQALKNNLNEVERLRFLFGQPRFISEIDPNKTQTRSYEIEDSGLSIPLERRLEQSKAARECSDWIKAKVDIKSMVKPNFLHGKLYHIIQSNRMENAIMGSSNFTVNGLGLGGSPNIELNLEVADDRDRKDLLNWFDDLWNDEKGLVRDVKDEVLKYLQQLYANNSPEFIYYKTLYHLFEKYLGEQADIGIATGRAGFLDSEIWNKLYSFQKDGVKGAINKLERHNGCIIADSVGLGKTYEALAIIRYYESLNYRVLVICPKKLKDNWTVYQSQKNNKLNPFQRDRFSYNVIYHTDLGRLSGTSDADGLDLSTFNWGAYDLIVIDESHNLRGNPREKEVDGELIYNRARFLMEMVIKSGARSKILMLSATPVNTTLKDLRNQIHYITEGKDDALMESLGIENISTSLKTAQTQFANWIKRSQGKDRNVNDLFTVLDSGFFKLLDELTIARSRKHIMSFYYAEQIGAFPKRLKPGSVYAEIDLKKRFYSYDKVNEEIMGYSLSLFNPSEFLKQDFARLYEEGSSKRQFTQATREKFLIGMMKMNFMKRLESSVHSFKLTLERTLNKIESLIDRIEYYQRNHDLSTEIAADQLDPDFALMDDEELEAWNEANTVGKKLKFRLEHLRLDDWLAALKRDKDQLLSLYNAANQVTPEQDAKLAEIKKLIKAKLEKPLNEGNQKVLVFTAFADTAEYLYKHLHPWFKEQFGLHSAIVSGSGMCKTTLKMPARFQNDFNAILTCFAPQAKERDKRLYLPAEDIDLLIGTDCISEGQNLQDCDCVINFDIHWNPVRIIQRYGRIDRLNSPNAKIRMHNFWPTKDLDKYIDLKRRVEARMIMVDMTATGEDNVISDKDIEDIITDDMRFRTRQLKKLQNEVIDLEDLDESISLTDFNLDDYRIDLMNYLKANEQQLREAPLGTYAVTASPGHELWQACQAFTLTDAHRQVLRPGVVFCLKHIPDGKDLEKLNPLHPYFLVYLHDDGEVRFHHSNAKQILELYRLLCSERDKAIDALYDIFESSTDQGRDMKHYNKLILKAIEDIHRSLERKSQAMVQHDRGALIPVRSKQPSNNQFELITWLVIL